MKLRFFIVGSTLHLERPGDLDLLGVMTREDFISEFGLTPEEWNDEWQKEPSMKLDLYKAKCRGATHVLCQIFDKRHIDFKFVAEPMPYGKFREIEIVELFDVN